MSVVTRPRRRIGGMEILAVAALALVLLQPFLAGRLTNPAVQAGATVFVSIVIQALPFLVLGVVLSAAIAAFVPASFWRKALPKRPGLAVPVAGCAGAVLPGCECASVPVSGSLMSRGVAPAAALAFLLSAPAINPIVVISTFVAFPGQPMMAVARFGASLVTAVIVGWIWLRWGRGEWLRIPTSRHVEGQSRWQTFAAAATHDLLHAGGFLVVGGIAAAVLNVAIPQQWLQTLAEHPALAIVGLALLAVLLSICSEADAFVAASLTQFSLTARLAFLVVGPMVDLKLISLQAGTFGKSFMYRFAPTTFVMAVLMATVFGWWLL
ncbi:MAG TPA: permease [Candidatus Nanopelagicales bacterium]|nr:permease [Candidatus Nanopelagicales bacterium]